MASQRSSDLTRRTFVRTTVLAASGLVSLRGVNACLAGTNTAAAPLPGSSPLPLTQLKTLLQETVREMEKHVPYASALLMRRRNTSISIDERTREVDDLYPMEGAVFTIHNGGWFEEAATTSLDPSTLRATALALARSARLREGDVDIDPGEGGERHFRSDCTIDPRQLPLAERFAWATDFRARARATDPSLRDCQTNYMEQVGEEVFVNRAKAWSQDVLRVRLNVGYIAADDHRTATSFDRRGGTGGLELLEFDEDALAELAREAHLLLDAGRVEPGSYEVVVDGSVTGTVAHESFGHGVELDLFVKDRALAEQYLGKRVGSELVNIVDDPSLPHAFGSYAFDHEGQRAAPVDIVERGIFTRGLSDLMSASRLAMARTAHGRRQDISRKTYARMSNTFFTPGDQSPDELVQGVERGFLVQRFTHGMEDPKGWGILVGAHIGREIVDGKLTGRLFSPIGITGYVPDVLNSVDGVGNDFMTGPGVCGKGFKEFVPIAAGGPHVRFTARIA